MKRHTKSIALISCVLSVLALFLITGCGGSSQTMRGEEQAGEVEDIDALLGLTDDSGEEETEEEIADDDVLRLLGVKEEGQSTESAVKKEEASQTQQQTEARAAEEKQAAADAEEKPASRTARTTLSFQDRYRQALDQYYARNYREAIQSFQNLLNENMTHSLSDNCQYWIGECYWGLGDYQQAAVAFQKVFTFSRSNKDPDAQLKLGLCFLRMGDKVRAKQEFQKLIDNYPASDRVSIAKRYIADLE